MVSNEVKIVRAQSPEAREVTLFGHSARAERMRKKLIPSSIDLGPRARGLVVQEQVGVHSIRAAGGNDDEVVAYVLKVEAARVDGLNVQKIQAEVEAAIVRVKARLSAARNASGTTKRTKLVQECPRPTWAEA